MSPSRFTWEDSDIEVKVPKIPGSALKGWVTIHGHPVLIGAPDSGGGGSGGGAMSSGGGKGSNAPKHGGGGKSKYPTLDAYKKGQIDHATAMGNLQQDIKAAKLAGDKSAVTTLTTQYYNIKKAGPAPKETGVPKHDNTPTIPAHSAPSPYIASEAHKITEDFVNDKITHAEMHNQLDKLAADSGHSKDDLIAAAKKINDENYNKSGLPAVGQLSGAHMEAIKGSPVHMYAEGMESQIKGGVASQGDIWDLHSKIDSAISEEKNKAAMADQAIGAAKLNGIAVLPSIQKMKDDAELKQKGYQELKSHMEKVAQDNIAKPAPVSLPTKKPDPDAHQPSLIGSAPKTPAQKYEDQMAPHIAKAQLLQEKLANGQIKKVTYNTQMSQLSKKSGLSTTQLKNAANAENQKKMLGTAAKPVSSSSATTSAPAGIPTHVQHALAIQEKYEKGLIKQSTYQQSMYKLAKANNMSTQQLHSAVAQHKAGLGSVTPTTAPITPGGLHKTTNPLPLMTDAQAAKVGAMPPAKQDLIKLGAVYDQHGPGSKEYEAAVTAYNQKHGTNYTYSSVGPEVKKVKQEAGIPIVAQNKTPPPSSSSSYSSGSSYAPPPTKNWTHEEIHNDKPLEGAGMSSHELNSWGMAASKEWADSLTGPQRSSVQAYTGSSYSSINGQLRAGGVLSTSAQSHIAHIDQALDKASLPRPITTMRGFSNPTLIQKMNAGLPLTGAVFHDKGYISSSLNHGSSFGGEIKMKINIPKGAKAQYLGHISNFGTAESEVLLARNANFRIKGYTKVGGQWQIEVDYIGSGDMPAGAFKAQSND